jgi:hypothetical protein
MRTAYKLLLGKPEGKSMFGESDANRRIILKWIMWMLLFCQDRLQSWASVNAVMNVWVTYKVRNSCSAKQP